MLVICVGMSAGEVLWWRHARTSYPHALTEETPNNANDLVSLRHECGNPMEIKLEGADMALVRCGDFWPMRSIWLVPKASVALQ